MACGCDAMCIPLRLNLEPFVDAKWDGPLCLVSKSSRGEHTARGFLGFRTENFNTLKASDSIFFYPSMNIVNCSNENMNNIHLLGLNRERTV